MVAAEVRAAVLNDQAVLGADQREVLKGHEVGVVQLDVRRAGERVGPVDRRDHAADEPRFGRVRSRVARPLVVPDAGRAADDGVAHVNVIAGVDEDRIAGPQVVGAQHRQQDRLGVRRRLAGVAVVADGGGRVLVVRVVVVVHVELVAVGHDGERLARAVQDRGFGDRRDANAIALRDVAGDPARRRVQRQRRPAHGSVRGGHDRDVRDLAEAHLDQVDVDVAGQFLGQFAVVERVPQDDLAHVVLKVGVEVGRVDLDVGGLGQRRLHGVAVGAEVDAAARGGGFVAEEAQGIAAVDAGGGRVRQVVVVVGKVHEHRVVQERVGDRVADRVVVEVGLDLPVEQVREGFLPEDGPAGGHTTGGEQVVVVAVEADLAVGVDVQVEAVLRPDDVVAERDVLRSARQAHAVARRRVDRVVRDRDNVAGGDEDGLADVSVQHVVVHVRGVVHLDARRVVMDLIEAHGRVVVREDARRVVVDVVGLAGGPVRAAEGAEAADAGRVEVDVVAESDRVQRVGEDAVRVAE